MVKKLDHSFSKDNKIICTMPENWTIGFKWQRHFRLFGNGAFWLKGNDVREAERIGDGIGIRW